MMIEHYSIHEIHKLTDRFGLSLGVPKGVKPRYNVSPAQSAPVILQVKGTTELRMMQWGLVPTGAKDTNSVFRYKTFNIKSEKVFSKPSWDAAVRQQRCIIPANGFYMIRRENKDAYYFTASEGSLLAIAGIYTVWTDPVGTERQMFSMLTIDSNDAMPLPFGRMPVLLHSDDEDKWIGADVQDFSTLVTAMRPYEGNALQYRKVSNDVASAKIDMPYLIDSIGV